jgi:hypothetical protein
VGENVVGGLGLGAASGVRAAGHAVWSRLRIVRRLLRREQGGGGERRVS